MSSSARAQHEPRAPFLAFDTSTPVGSVAIGRGDEVLAEAVIGVSTRHSEALLPTIDFLLQRAGVQRAGLAGIVVAGGPGSFTGVRIAAATAKGFARALGVPVYAWSGLISLAASLGAGAAPVCALFDARRGEVYAACCRFPEFARVDILLPPMAAPLAEVLALTMPMQPIYAGEGALRYRQEIAAAGGTVAPAHLSIARASALLWLADLAPEQGLVADVHSWQPDYLRDSGAERTRST